MKKITVVVLTLCVMLSAAGCNEAVENKTESTSEVTTQATTTEKAEDTSAPEANVQTAESTAKEDTDIIPTETDIHILDVDKQTMFNYEWSEKTAALLVECECSVVLLGGEDAERYPQLAEALSENIANQQIYINEEFAVLREYATDPDSLDTLVSTKDMQVRRADSTVFSVLYDFYFYNGMNDGARGFGGATYDTNTGKVLHLPDIVTDLDMFAQAVEDQLFGIFGADVFHRDDIIKEYFEMYGADGTHWTLDYNGITVYFDEGEIADAGFGAISVTITFAENPELFKEKYTAVPEAYIVALPMKSAFYTDLDGDGSCGELSIYDRYDEENNYYATVDICTAEEVYTESFWAYDCEPYYVKTADGNNYLYLFTELETQMYLYVYNINGGTVSKVGEANVSPYYNDGITALLTDPESMHFDIFNDEAGGGVPDGNDIFAVGVDGMPAQG